MKRRRKNNILPIIAACLAVVLLIGSVGVLIPNTPFTPGASSKPSDNEKVCAHTRVVGGGVINAGTADEQFEYLCTACGESILCVTGSAFKDNLPVRLEETVNGTTTYSIAYTGNWSMGYMDGITFVPYNSFYEGKGTWLAADRLANKGLFRLYSGGSTTAYWKYAFGLGWENMEDCILGINYQAEQSGTIAVSISNFNYDATENYSFNVLVNGVPVHATWPTLSSCGANSAEKLNDFFALNFKDIQVEFGDQVTLAVRHNGTNAVDTSLVLPVITYTSFGFEHVGPCDGNAHTFEGGACRVCGSVAPSGEV